MSNGSADCVIWQDTKGNTVTLRDLFAGMALQGLLAHTCTNDVPIWKAKEAANRAFEIADAILKQREATP